MLQAQKHIPVFYEGSDDLIAIIATSIASICYNTKSFIDFYILDCGICNFNKKQLESLKSRFSNFSIEFIPVDLSQFEGLSGWGEKNHLDCYARLLIPELKPNLDKIIYLDSDVIALDDINLLWLQDLENYVYAAVPDLGYSEIYLKNCVENLGLLKEHIFPNAGVLLIDAQKCRKINFTQEILSIAREKKEFLLANTEDLLSIYFGTNNYKRLDNRYNLTDRKNEIESTSAPFITNEYLKNEWQHIVFQHLSPGKAWKIATNHYTGDDLKLFDDFWFFAQMTPFFEGLKLRFIQKCINREISEKFKQKQTKESLKLFSFLPLLNINQKADCVRYKLFGYLPIMKKKIRRL
ncbi:MAG: glycosyltransferase family 8 protein [Alphaproteobacteria bacterium]|nr:glycosyltransferase family 8 protein [Alphaproteobacteria bacterium]